MDFQNEPSIDISEHFGNGKFAHIFAKATDSASGHYRSTSTTMINLGKGINFSIFSADVATPTLVVYGEKNNTTDHSFCDSAAIRMNQGDNAIKIRKPVKIHSQANSVNDNSSAYSSAVVIGNPSDSTDSRNNANIRGNNVFDIKGGMFKALALSSNDGNVASTSVAATIGTATTEGNAILDGNNTFNVNGSTLIASATSNLSSVTATIGTAIHASDDSIIQGNNTYNIKGSGSLFAAFSNGKKDYDGIVSAASAVVFGSSAYGAFSNIRTGGKNIYSVESDNIFTAVATTVTDKNAKIAAATTFGAATNISVSKSTASGQSINLDGNQIICALAHGDDGKVYEGIPLETKVNVFGADITDKSDEDGYGWRVGLRNETSDNAIVSILGAKLADNIKFENDAATIILRPDQGSIINDVSADEYNRNNTYARAFALGEDFQIYIGGKSKISRDPETKVLYIPGENEEAFEAVGKSGIANIFGAIAPAQNSKLDADGRCPKSKLVIDSGWDARVYGPLEALESIQIKKGVLNAYGSLRNITLDGSTLNAYGTSDNIGKII